MKIITRLSIKIMKARGFVEKYNWDDIVDEFEGILEEVT